MSYHMNARFPCHTRHCYPVEAYCQKARRGKQTDDYCCFCQIHNQLTRFSSHTGYSVAYDSRYSHCKVTYTWASDLLDKEHGWGRQTRTPAYAADLCKKSDQDQSWRTWAQPQVFGQCYVGVGEEFQVLV